MRTQNNWGNTIKSQQQSFLMNSFISTFSGQTEHLQKQDLNRSLYEMDKKLSKLHAHEYYDPNLVKSQLNTKIFQSSKLSLPKSNTLTDALLRTTLGCDQKYAKQYLQILNQTSISHSKQQRIQQVKKMFATSNSHIDFCANSKPYMPFKRKNQLQLRPVVDNQHQGYLKTQLIFLEKPHTTKITEKQYYDKHYDLISKKIEELGGMEDTLGKMEDTLSKNQLKSSKKRQMLEELSSSPRKNPFSLPKKSSKSSTSTVNSGNSWIERSKVLRENFKNKMHIS